MICKSCNLNEICKLYEYLGKQRYADVQINSCRFNPNASISLNDERFDNSKLQKGIEMNERRMDMPVDNKVIAQYRGKAKPDLREIEKKVCNIPDKPESIKVNCPGCKILTYDDELTFCTKCGDPICSDCGTAVDGQKLCPKCWGKYGNVEEETDKSDS